MTAPAALSLLAAVCEDSGAGLAGQVDDLLGAARPEQMARAAERLRATAQSAWRLLACPAAAGDSPGPGTRLADQTVNLLTALDYLLGLLSPHEAPATRLVLADGPGHAQDRTEEARDRLARRRLDARAAAVREGTLLLAQLRGAQARAHDAGPA